jgi:general secretion pathway protein D
LIDDQDRKNISGLPGLSKLPILGRLFGTHADDKTKTEIMLSITPHIIRERRFQTANQADMWMGSEGQAGRSNTSPAFGAGANALLLPRAAPVVQNQSPPPKSENINIPLPPGFSLGNGLPPVKDNQ